VKKHFEVFKDDFWSCWEWHYGEYKSSTWNV